MSIVVDLEKLAEKLAEYPYGYLLTSADRAVKAVTVTATVLDGAVIIPTGSRGSARNLAANPTATLLCPPTTHHGYSLIVDGTAVPEGEGFRLDPTTAVLHRPADHNDQPVLDGEVVPHTHDSACGHDCRPVG